MGTPLEAAGLLYFRRYFLDPKIDPDPPPPKGPTWGEWVGLDSPPWVLNSPLLLVFLVLHGYKHAVACGSLKDFLLQAFPAHAGSLSAVGCHV